MTAWKNIHAGDRIELGLVQVDIADSSNLPGNERDRKEARSIFRDHMLGIARIHEGKLFNWGGDGGSFMFRIKRGESFDAIAHSVIQMFNSMPEINKQILALSELVTPIDVRISCDEGTATYDPNPGKIIGAFIDRFLKNERAIGFTNGVSITDRVWAQLTPRLKARFGPFKFSEELDCQLYRYGSGEEKAGGDGTLQGVKSTAILQNIRSALAGITRTSISLPESDAKTKALTKIHRAMLKACISLLRLGE